MSAEPLRILVVANETVGGRPLIDAVKRHAEEAHARGQAVPGDRRLPAEPAQARLRDRRRRRCARRPRTGSKLTIAQLREVGIEAAGEVMDHDPYGATMDAHRRVRRRRGHHLDPPRDALGLAAPRPDRPRPRRQRAARRARRRRPRRRPRRGHAHARRRQPDRRRRAADRPAQGQGRRVRRHRFIVIVPQSGVERRRRATSASPHMLERLEDEGLDGDRPGHADADPFTAIQNALHFYAVDEIVISTFPGDPLGLAAQRPDRAACARRPASPSSTSSSTRPKRARERPPDGIGVASPLGHDATTTTTTTTGRREANQSSRVDAQFLGMLLFIISEVMLFGAFFTAYFFFRVVDERPVAGRRAPSCRC